MTSIPYAWKGAGRVRTLDEAEEQIRRSFNEWRRADYLTEGSLPYAYFSARGVAWLSAPRFRDVIRWRPDAWHPSGLIMPAIYCQVTSSSGGFRGIHRIYLKREKPEKFGVPASFGPIAGHAIKLASLEQIVAAGDIVIGEGLETTASACALLKLPGWCGIAAGNIRKSLVLPTEITRITIAVDRDRTGEIAAQRAAQRWRSEGRTVRLLTPTREGDDCNDILRRAS